ncbi:MAG TPA: STAS domain-containing protein [Acidobacteriota bacterium]|jgi:anti-anti-sigma factor|nr:STAS domain-containing protein [Acidobacteriota bacterium]HNR40056.1 STAS domain-containing protein [Acidobacteriota bacterium]HNU01318.1 STAS domain-containing protein [Acidobacteriota bacterium]HPB28154.1 STAS domain-containing protein [Acidobacteriota bacterium]HQO25728.1 STAS domain-containing protein [Acidobacteriota bacterium]
MQVEVSSIGGKWTVLAPQGRVDAHTVDDFEAAVRKELAGGARWLAMDLAGVPYMNSAGLRVLLIALKAVRPLEGGVVLARPQPQVLEILEISGFLKMFASITDIAELS